MIYGASELNLDSGLFLHFIVTKTKRNETMTTPKHYTYHYISLHSGH